MTKCIDCGLEPEEQVKQRRLDFRGLCVPGRCVVNGTAWFVWPDGSPLDFVTPIEQDLANSLHAAGLGHLSPIPPTRINE